MYSLQLNLRESKRKSWSWLTFCVQPLFCRISPCYCEAARRVSQRQSSLNISELRHQTDTQRRLCPQWMCAVMRIHFIHFPRTAPAVHFSRCCPCHLLPSSFSFDRSVNIYTEPISLGDLPPFTLRHSFRKLLMLDHKGLMPPISMYIPWISPRQSPNFNFIGLLSMSARAWARTQCKLKRSVSAQGEKRNRHNDIQHSDWNDRC